MIFRCLVTLGSIYLANNVHTKRPLFRPQAQKSILTWMSSQKSLKQSVATLFKLWGSGRPPQKVCASPSTILVFSLFQSISYIHKQPYSNTQYQHRPSSPSPQTKTTMPSAYTPTQLSHYLTHISLPPHLHPSPPSSSPPSPSTPSTPLTLTLPLLTALHTHQLATIPYENLSLHYSPHHTVRLDPQHLYRKLVTGGRGRGGYCMEIAVLFNHVLRGLGFEVYTAGARVRPVCGCVLGLLIVDCCCCSSSRSIL